MAREKILVVEDEAVVALDIQNSLRKLGYTVPRVAITGEEAVAQVAELQPDLILMDIRLQGKLDGIEAAVSIRKNLNVPVIFLTAYADESTLQRAKRAEPFAYLLKPFEERMLATAIEITLHKHRAQVTLLRELTQAFEQSEERFRQLVASIRDYAVILLDANGHILNWNPGAQALFGYPADQTLGRHVAMIFPAPALAELSPEQILQAATTQDRYREQGWRVRQDQSRFWGDTTVVALKTQNGQVFCFLTVTREMGLEPRLP